MYVFVIYFHSVSCHSSSPNQSFAALDLFHLLPPTQHFLQSLYASPTLIFFTSLFWFSSLSTWLWPETTAQSAWGATAGLQTPWTTATTPCPAPSTLGEIRFIPVLLYLSSNNLPDTRRRWMHFTPTYYLYTCNCCRSSSFLMVNSFIFFPAKIQYFAKPAAQMQMWCRAEGISAELLLYTWQQTHGSPYRAILSYDNV